MSKVGILGIIALFGSMVLFTFELIGKTMNHSDSQAVSLLDIIGKDKGEFSIPKIEFPALSLLVSGGHT